MSHVKNVQAFGKLMGICTGYGGTYNPGQQNLQVNAMATCLNIAQQLMTDVMDAQTAYNNVSNAREVAFRQLRRLSSRVYMVLKASGTHPLTLEDANRSTRRIWGRKRTKNEPTPATEPVLEKPQTGFRYSQNYPALAYHFGQLVKTVVAEPKYQAQEPDLSKEGLEARLAELHEHNRVVTLAEVALNQARQQRNEQFYRAAEGLVATALAVKQYVRGVFGFNSPQHQEVKRLHFNKPGSV